MSPAQPLLGKVVLVTGAGVRVGRAIAERLASAGAVVALHHHRSQEGAQAVLRAILDAGGRGAVFSADLTDVAQIEGLVSQVEHALGPLWGLVNSAGLYEGSGFLETSVQVLDRLWAVNARGAYALTQVCARQMVARRAGSIVNVLDIGGALIPWRSHAAYCMTKAALASLTECLALELAPDVRVNGVAPGVVAPSVLDSKRLESLRRRIPQQRFGSPEDVADAVAFLMTGPTFITGQILAVDGGRHLGPAQP